MLVLQEGAELPARGRPVTEQDIEDVQAEVEQNADLQDR